MTTRVHPPLGCARHQMPMLVNQRHRALVAGHPCIAFGGFARMAPQWSQPHTMTHAANVNHAACLCHGRLPQKPVFLTYFGQLGPFLIKEGALANPLFYLSDWDVALGKTFFIDTAFRTLPYLLSAGNPESAHAPIPTDDGRSAVRSGESP